MNIQQALNQGLISAATSAYLTDQILEQGKQSAIGEYQAASNERNESYKQNQIVHDVQKDDWKEQLDKDVKKGTMTQAEADENLKELVKTDSKVISAKERKVVADRRFKRAERNLDKWVNPNEANSYKKIAESDNDTMLNSLFEDVPAARAEAKALRSQQRQQSTASNQAQAMEKRKKILNSKYNVWTPGQEIPQGYQPIVNKILGQEE